MNFERSLVDSFNNYFSIHDIPADVHRWPQLRFINQPCDIIIDSPVVGHLAFECKSTASNRLYFSGHFHKRKDGTHQMVFLDDYFYRSARTSYLAVELKNKGKKNRCCFLDWNYVLGVYKSGQKSLAAEKEIVDNACVVYRTGGFYQLDAFFEL